ncbi:amino acid permease C-terminal domain-containing protein, partial [Actinoplanes sp. NPDC026623]|uniref:amino acid permease C-terminal domain-containing protein n=1 Tax=Actinoplanes sp. NPDC026623 TaxID=3155610 RepID=UPI0033C33A90
RLPGMPVIPALGVIFSIWLITFLTPTTWLRFAVWFIIGMIIYFAYGRHHSKLSPTREPADD